MEENCQYEIRKNLLPFYTMPWLVPPSVTYTIVVDGAYFKTEIFK